MAEGNQKREAALQRWQESPDGPDEDTRQVRTGFRAGYDAALADNAEREKQNQLAALKLCNDEIAQRQVAESALAEARATIERLEAELRKHRPFVMGTPI